MLTFKPILHHRTFTLKCAASGVTKVRFDLPPRPVPKTFPFLEHPVSVSVAGCHGEGGVSLVGGVGHEVLAQRHRLLQLGRHRGRGGGAGQGVAWRQRRGENPHNVLFIIRHYDGSRAVDSDSRHLNIVLKGANPCELLCWI